MTRPAARVVDLHLVGHVCVDFTPGLLGDPDTTPGVLTAVGPMRVHVGGAVANAARAVAGMGGRPAITAAVGDDVVGSLLRDLLTDEFGDAVSLVELPTRSTSYSVVVAPPGADRHFWHHTGANDDFDGRCELYPAPIVHFGYPTLCPGMTADGGRPTSDLFRRARAQGSATSLDLAYCADNSPLRDYDWDGYFRHVMPWTDVFCPSWDDVTSARRQAPNADRAAIAAAAEEFVEMGAGVVLLTLGEHGSYLATGPASHLGSLGTAIGIDPDAWAGVREWIPAAPVPRFVSSNGAGDTFKAAFLLSAVGAATPVEAATRAARIVARKIGGLPLAGDDA